MNKHNAKTLKGQTLIKISVEVGIKNGQPYHAIKHRPVKVNDNPNIVAGEGCDIVIDGNSSDTVLIYENGSPIFTSGAGSTFFLFPARAGSLHGYSMPENAEAATKKLSTALLDALDDKIQALRLDLKMAESLESYISNL